MNANRTTKRTSRRLLHWVGAAVAATMLSGSALAAGITATKHNLSSTGTFTNKTTSTNQICVFCHTPHGGDTTAPVPLWNKKLNVTGAVYSTYDQLNTSTLNGSILPVGSVSLACLSCHDGTQAMDNIINAPGSGGYNATGGGAAGIGFTWTLPAANKLTVGPFPMIGTDLKNDHPVGVQYCGGGLTGAGAVVSGTCKAGVDYVAAAATTTSDGRPASVKTALINGSQQFWVDVDGLAGRGKGDMKLYTRDFTSKGGVAAEPSVECASCHDPHVESKGTDNIMFMRVTTSGSQLCLSCHIK